MASLSLDVKTLKPLGDRILIKVVSQEEKTTGGILLPDTAKEKPQTGEVVAVGSGVPNKKGERIPPEVAVGSQVLYSKYAGTEVKLGDETHMLLTEKDILAVVES